MIFTTTSSILEAAVTEVINLHSGQSERMLDESMNRHIYPQPNSPTLIDIHQQKRGRNPGVEGPDSGTWTHPRANGAYADGIFLKRSPPGEHNEMEIQQEEKLTDPEAEWPYLAPHYYPEVEIHRPEENSSGAIALSSVHEVYGPPSGSS